jgi:hypothetical protein
MRSVRDDARGFLVEMLEMTAGPLIWFAHLVLVYGASSIGCSRQGEALFGGRTVDVVTAVSTLLALAASAWLLRHGVRDLRAEGRSEARNFVDRVTIALAGFGVIGIVWTALPALLGPACPT